MKEREKKNLIDCIDFRKKLKLKQRFNLDGFINRFLSLLSFFKKIKKIYLFIYLKKREFQIELEIMIINTNRREERKREK